MEKHRWVYEALLVGARARGTKRCGAAFLVSAVLFLILHMGYAMQPPPPPLDLMKLKELVSEADLIAVAEVGEVRETEKVVDGHAYGTTEADVSIERVLKGKLSGDHLLIRESYPVLNPSSPGAARTGEGKSREMIGIMKAGPRAYHGHYERGMRIIVLLEKIEGARAYKPLGSGSYNAYLCEFVVEKDGIEPLYFKFAENLSRYTASESLFTNLLHNLILGGE